MLWFNREQWLPVSMILLLAAVSLAACFRGQPKEKPPIHPIPDMDLQPRYRSQSEGEFFANNMTMRPPVYGTVPRGELPVSDSLYRGLGPGGEPLAENPMTVDMQMLERGQRQYDIYCAPCHSRIGDGRGIMIEYNYVPPASFHSERLRNVPDGHVFDVITNGLRNMPGYAHQITVTDRWAIVAYIRALQRSQHASLSDVPEERQSQLK